MGGRILPRNITPAPWLNTNPITAGSGPTPAAAASPAPSSAGGSYAVYQAIEQQIELPRGLVTEEFSRANVPASLTASKLYRIIADSAGVTTAQIPVRPPFRGSVVGLALQSTAPRTAGTATFTVYVKGSPTLSVVWGLTDHEITTVAAGRYPFAVGEDIDVRVTTSATFAPTTADVELIVYLAQSSSGSEG